MSGYSNVTFDELEIGATASAERMVGQSEIEALLLVSAMSCPSSWWKASRRAERPVRRGGGRGGHHLRHAGAPASGPGTRVVSQQLEFNGVIRVGDLVRATVTVREKTAENRRVLFACTVDAAGETVLCGKVIVEAPHRKASFPDCRGPSS